MCDNVYNRKDKLEKHKTTCGSNMVRVREAPTEEYKCDACEKIFTKNAYLSQQSRRCCRAGNNSHTAVPYTPHVTAFSHVECCGVDKHIFDSFQNFVI